MSNNTRMFKLQLTVEYYATIKMDEKTNSKI